jgi:hypothetical protein
VSSNNNSAADDQCTKSLEPHAPVLGLLGFLFLRNDE